MAAGAAGGAAGGAMLFNWIAAGAAVVGAGVSVYAQMDAARRAEHAAEDANVYNTQLVDLEKLRAQTAISQTELNRKKMLGTIAAQASKSGFSITGDSTPSWLLDDTNTEFDKDVEMITMDSEQRILSRQFGMGDIESKASATRALAYSGAFSSLVKGASDVSTSGIWKVNSGSTNQGF